MNDHIRERTMTMSRRVVNKRTDINTNEVRLSKNNRDRDS